MPRAKTTRAPRKKRASGATVKGRGAYTNMIQGGSRPFTGVAKTQYSYTNPGPVGRFGRAVGSAIGARYGGPLGAQAGNAIGGLAHYVGRLFGSGAYKVGMAPTVNSLFKGTTGKNLSFGRDDSIRIKRREYIGDIISSSTASTFEYQAFPINPGLIGTFPWLSQMATMYQTYKMHGCVFEYKSTSADALNSTNTQLGTVITCTDYNTASRDFRTKQDMLNSYGGLDIKTSESCFAGVECDPKKLPMNELYIRSATVSATDIRLSDMGNFYIGTTGCQGQSVRLGELYVIYDVELMLPINPIQGLMVQSLIYQLYPGSVNTSVYLGKWNLQTPNIAVIEPGTKDAISHGLDTSNILVWSDMLYEYISFPQNSNGSFFKVDMYYEGSLAALCNSPTIVGINGCTIPFASVAPLTIAVETSRTLKITNFVKVPGVGEGATGRWTMYDASKWPSIRVSKGSGNLPGTIVNASVTITQVNGTIDDYFAKIASKSQA